MWGSGTCCEMRDERGGSTDLHQPKLEEHAKYHENEVSHQAEPNLSLEIVTYCGRVPAVPALASCSCSPTIPAQLGADISLLMVAFIICVPQQRSPQSYQFGCRSQG